MQRVNQFNIQRTRFLIFDFSKGFLAQTYQISDFLLGISRYISKDWFTHRLDALIKLFLYKTNKHINYLNDRGDFSSYNAVNKTKDSNNRSWYKKGCVETQPCEIQGYFLAKIFFHCVDRLVSVGEIITITKGPREI